MLSFTTGSMRLPDMLRIRVQHRFADRSPQHFDVIADMPLDDLRRAVALTMGADGSASGGAVRGRVADRTVGFLLAPRFGAEETLAVDGALEIAREGSRRTSPGEPRIRVIDDHAEVLRPYSAPPWFDADAPFRAPHAQHELERIFGYVLPSPDPCGIPFPGPLVPTAAMRALLRSLDPAMRLALRAHLDDIHASGPRGTPARDIDAALAGLSQLATHVAGEGVPQGEGGWLEQPELRALEETLHWPHDVGAGARLESLARRLRLVRRNLGRIVGTARGRRLGASTTVPHVRDLLAPGVWAGGGEAGALALLVVSDGTAASLDDVDPLVERALRRIGFDEGAAARAATASDRVAAVLSPLGGVAAYGVLTEAVRTIAHEALFLDSPPSRWADEPTGAETPEFF